MATSSSHNVIVSVGIIGANDNPLYIRTFQEEEDLESHFVIHMSLDIVEEKSTFVNFKIEY